MEKGRKRRERVKNERRFAMVEKSIGKAIMQLEINVFGRMQSSSRKRRRMKLTAC